MAEPTVKRHLTVLDEEAQKAAKHLFVSKGIVPWWKIKAV